MKRRQPSFPYKKCRHGYYKKAVRGLDCPSCRRRSRILSGALWLVIVLVSLWIVVSLLSRGVVGASCDHGESSVGPVHLNVDGSYGPVGKPHQTGCSP